MIVALSGRIVVSSTDRLRNSLKPLFRVIFLILINILEAIASNGPRPTPLALHGALLTAFGCAGPSTGNSPAVAPSAALRAFRRLRKQNFQGRQSALYYES
jgi:Trk-type K+ transport system membrane component